MNWAVGSPLNGYVAVEVIWPFQKLGTMSSALQFGGGTGGEECKVPRISATSVSL